MGRNEAGRGRKAGKKGSEEAPRGAPGPLEDDLYEIVLGALPPELRRWRECQARIEDEVAGTLEAAPPPPEVLLDFFAPLLDGGPPDEDWYPFAAIHLMYHWRPRPGDPTAAERVEASGRALAEDERFLLKALREARPSLYEVVETHPDKGMLVRDRFRGDRTEFVDGMDHALAYERGDLLPARIVAAGPYHLLDLLGVPAPADYATDALEWLEGEFRGFANRKGTLDRDAFLAELPVRVPQATMVVLANVEEQGWDEGFEIEPDESAAPARRAKPSNKIYELEITLLDCPIDIRRVVAIHGDRTLDELHLLIQAAMGWEDCHLHRFQGGTRGGWQCADPRQGLEGTADESATTVAEAAPRKGSRFLYEYDFGDDWRHEIRVLARRDATQAAREPTCLGGCGACPPEDSGGGYGYAWKLEVLADPEHEEYEETRQWIGGAFDPTHFDVEEANLRIAALEE